MLRPNQNSDLLAYLLVEKAKSKPWRSAASLEELEAKANEAKKTPQEKAAEIVEKAPLQQDKAQQQEEKEEVQVVSKLSGAIKPFELLLAAEVPNKPGHKGKGQGRGNKADRAAGRGRGSGPGSAKRSLSLNPESTGFPLLQRPRIEQPSSSASANTAAPAPADEPMPAAVGAEQDLWGAVGEEPAREPVPEPDSTDGSSVANSRKSLATTACGGRRKSPLEKLQAQADRYVDLLDVSAALEGRALGNLRYQTDRILDAMKCLDAQATSEYINLTAKARLFNMCEKLGGGGMKTMSPAERDVELQEVCNSVPTLPSSFTVKVLAQAVRELPLTDENEVASWLSMIDPTVPGQLSS